MLFPNHRVGEVLSRIWRGVVVCPQHFVDGHAIVIEAIEVVSTGREEQGVTRVSIFVIIVDEAFVDFVEEFFAIARPPRTKVASSLECCFHCEDIGLVGID